MIDQLMSAAFVLAQGGPMPEVVVVEPDTCVGGGSGPVFDWNGRQMSFGAGDCENTPGEEWAPFFIFHWAAESRDFTEAETYPLDGVNRLGAVDVNGDGQVEIVALRPQDENAWLVIYHYEPEVQEVRYVVINRSSLRERDRTHGLAAADWRHFNLPAGPDEQEVCWYWRINGDVGDVYTEEGPCDPETSSEEASIGYMRGT